MEDKLNAILKAIDEYHQSCNPKDSGLLIVAGNQKLQLAAYRIIGDPVVLGQAINYHMETHPEVKRLILSLLGSYLSTHPEDKEMFRKGLDIIPTQTNMN